MGTYEWKPFTLLVSAEEVEKEVLRIEAGKYYRTRDGRKVGPMVDTNNRTPFTFSDGDGRVYRETGICGQGTVDYGSFEGDLISEWQDETPPPIRVLTRREVAPGNYGIVAITKSNKLMIAAGNYDVEQIREAAHILNQIAEALAENGK